MPHEMLPQSGGGLPAHHPGDFVDAFVCLFQPPLRSQESQMNQPLMRSRTSLPEKLSREISR